MQKDQMGGLRGFIRSLVAALVLLAVILLVPPTGQGSSDSFWVIARMSLWANLGDWLAAWCSVKIILLSASVFFLIQAVDELVMAVRRDYMSANWFLGLAAIPSIIFMVGAFYLFKALL